MTQSLLYKALSFTIQNATFCIMKGSVLAYVCLGMACRYAIRPMYVRCYRCVASCLRGR